MKHYLIPFSAILVLAACGRSGSSGNDNKDSSNTADADTAHCEQIWNLHTELEHGYSEVMYKTTTVDGAQSYVHEEGYRVLERSPDHLKYLEFYDTGKGEINLVKVDAMAECRANLQKAKEAGNELKDLPTHAVVNQDGFRNETVTVAAGTFEVKLVGNEKDPNNISYLSTKYVKRMNFLNVDSEIALEVKVLTKDDYRSTNKQLISFTP